MAASSRIVYGATSLGGIHIANAVRYATLAVQEALRAKGIADSVTAGGVTQANIEGSTEFSGAVSQGAVLYSAIVSLNTALQAITPSLLSNLDQGG